MKRVVLLVALLALCLSLTPALAKPGYYVTITVVGKDGSAVADATVEVFYEDGTSVGRQTTDASGQCTFEVTKNGTYLVVVSKEYLILDYFEVSGSNATKEINLTSGYYQLNVTSVPTCVSFNLTLGAVSAATYTDAATNATVYVPSGGEVTVSFPKEKKEYYVFKYVLEKVVYDSTETTSSEVTLTMDSDKVVTAHYEKTYAIVLETWMVVALVFVIALALFVAFRAGSHAAKEAIEEYRERSRKFVKRRR